MNKAEQKRRQAFLDEIKAVQDKHGYQLVVLQTNPQLTIQKQGEPVDGNATDNSQKQ